MSHTIIEMNPLTMELGREADRIVRDVTGPEAAAPTGPEAAAAIIEELFA